MLIVVLSTFIGRTKEQKENFDTLENETPSNENENENVKLSNKIKQIINNIL